MILRTGNAARRRLPSEPRPVLGRSLSETDSGPIDEDAHDAAEGIDGCLEAIATTVSAEMAADGYPDRSARSGRPRQDDQFRPALSGEPEIELVFRQARDPFAEQFEHEEVVVDPFATLETLESPLANRCGTGPDRADRACHHGGRRVSDVV